MPIPFPGELAALATAACWTLTALAFEAAGRRIGSLAVNLLRLSLATVLLSAFCAAVRGRPFPDDAPASAWLWLSLSGFVGLFLGDLFLFRALVVLGARLSTLVMSLAPFIAALLEWILTGSALPAGKWAGMALTFAGVAWVVLERRPAAQGPRKGSTALGVSFALLGAVGQGGGLVLSKIGMGADLYHPFASTQIRVLAGLAGFLVLFAALRAWPRLRDAFRDRKALGFTGLGAFFGPFLGVSLSLLSVQFIPAGVAQTMMSLVPVL
ncbi:MAG: DMT family transporter, partial [Planctomycetes bacterium]|nr:DMT family transporter [Planctomycetota bacterium]